MTRNTAFKTLIICLLVLLIGSSCTLSAQHYKILENDYQKCCLEISFGDLQSSDIKTGHGVFSQITMAECGASLKAGYPQLPILTKLIETPLCDGFSVTVTDAQYSDYDAAALGIAHDIYPAQPSYPKSYTGTPEFTKDAKAYTTDAFYSETLATVEKAGTLRDVNMASLSISPVAYNPVTKKVRLYTRLKVEITYNGSDIPNTLAMKSKYGSPLFTVAKNAVLNPTPALRSEFSHNTIHYLIISHPMFKGSKPLEEFISWKKRIGYKVTVAYTDDPTVGTTPLEIKNFIKTFYTEATPDNPAPTFLLFIGDKEQIPTFDGAALNTHVTDLYYATFDDDFIPDCYYGRFSAQNLSQLTPQIEKTLMYEQFTMPDPSYLGKAVLVAGTDLTWSYTRANGQINYIHDNYINEKSSTHHYDKVYKHLHDCSGQAGKIRDEIGDGVGWANYTAHGEYNGWTQPKFRNEHVNAMKNENKYGLIVGNCCFTGRFERECFAEFLVRAEKKGAMAYIGASESTYWDEDYFWSIGVRNTFIPDPKYNANHLGAFDRLFHSNGESHDDWCSTIGGFLTAGNLSVQSSNSDLKQYYWEIYHIFGDPSVKIYLGKPSQMIVSAESNMLAETAVYPVNAVPYAFVALTKDNELITSTFADAEGNATLQLDFSLEPGQYELAVSAQNYIQYFQDVHVIIPEGAYLSANIETDTVAASGHDIHWNLTCENVGIDTAYNAYALLTSLSDSVTLTVDSLYLGTIPVNTSFRQDLAFSGHIQENLADGTTTNLQLTLVWDSVSCKKNFKLNIIAPSLIVESHTIAATDNGVINSGDWVDVTIRFKNLGHGMLDTAGITLVSQFTKVQVQENHQIIRNLAAGDTLTLHFKVKVGQRLGTNLYIPLYLHAIYGITHLKETYYMYLGSALENFETGNFKKFDWDNTNIHPWEISTQSPHNGKFCMRSQKDLPNVQNSTIQITLDAVIDGNISYYRQVSCEKDYDKFIFYIDDQPVEEISGIETWKRVSFPVTAGTHTYKFTYCKDYAQSDGEDCVWIDDITFPGYGKMVQEDTIITIGIPEEDEFIIKAFPNPAHQYLNIRSSQDMQQISLFDVSGRRLRQYEISESQTTMPVAELMPGIYFIRIQFNNNQIKTLKFIKQ